MKPTDKIISDKCMSLADHKQATSLARYFKCRPGEYGEGDKFLGLRVPQVRDIVKKHLEEAIPADALSLVASEWHEIRLAGFLLLTELYKKAEKNKNQKNQDLIVALYLSQLIHCNNWDLVDLSAPHILGRHALSHHDFLRVIYRLCDDERLWLRRVGIVANLTLIKAGELDLIFNIAPRQFQYHHDLIHKATGWMLREAGKRDEDRLIRFLQANEPLMPRTTYRYATEIIHRKNTANKSSL